MILGKDYCMKNIQLAKSCSSAVVDSLPHGHQLDSSPCENPFHNTLMLVSFPVTSSKWALLAEVRVSPFQD